ncbi:MAG: hypothetical protein AAB967_03330, partial [Patescibacteria group bacterium]
ASSTPLFEYFDENYAGAGSALPSPVDISKIRVIRASLYVDVNPVTAPKPAFFTGTITVRNLRGN